MSVCPSVRGKVEILPLPRFLRFPKVPRGFPRAIWEAHKNFPVLVWFWGYVSSRKSNHFTLLLLLVSRMLKVSLKIRFVMNAIFAVMINFLFSVHSVVCYYYFHVIFALLLFSPALPGPHSWLWHQYSGCIKFPMYTFHK